MRPGIERARRNSLLLLALCAGISISTGFTVGNSVPGGMIGFQAVYYGTQCLLHHCDPYNESDLLAFYQAESGTHLQKSLQRRKSVTLYVNLPTTFLFIAPLAILPWGPAHTLWMILIAGSFVLAAVLIWDIGARHSPGVSLLLTCIVLVNSEIVFATANTAALVVSLGVIAAWCFVTDRFVPAGILCLAASLAIKPHDTGLIWLYFMLAGGVPRRRALQTLAVTAVLGVAAILWVSHAAPHWLPEMRANYAAISGHGGLNEPGPASMTGRGPTMVIDLQSVFSIFSNNSVMYNLLSYLICGALLAVWSVKTLRTRFSPASAWVALAAIAALTMLPTYHRPYDAKLLLLAIPACAMLWKEVGSTARTALAVTLAGVTITGDIPLAILALATNPLTASGTTRLGQMILLVLTRPAALILLAMGIFYLWIYMRRFPARGGPVPFGAQRDSAATGTPA